MGSYILNFTVYTMAMCGLIFFALFVYKKFATGNLCTRKSGFLGIEDTLSLAPRKTLFIIRAGEERFLIASDADKTSLISKLQPRENVNFETESQQPKINSKNAATKFHTPDGMPSAKTPAPVTEGKTRFIGVDDLPVIVPKGKNKSSNVIKSMVSRIKD